MTTPIKGCPQPDPPELVMRADGYHYRTEGEMKELTDEDLDRLMKENVPTAVRCPPGWRNAFRAAIDADRALNAEDHDPLEPKRLESIADPTLRAVCETYTNTPGGHFMRLQAIAKLVPAPADRAPRTYEQEYAIKEGHRNKIEDDYFDARTVFDLAPRPCFKDGFDRGWDAAKKDAPVDRKHQPAGTPVAWLLTDKKINDIQVDSVQRLIDRARQAHFTDLIIRINGKDEHYQADWLKHLVRAEVPVCAPADRDVMRQVPEGWKLVPIEPTLDQYNSACRAYSDWQVQCQEEAREHEDERNPSWGYSQPHFTHSDVYRAMLAAVPTPPAEQQETALPPLTCGRSKRSDCALYEPNRPSKEWYAQKIKETEGLDDALPSGALVKQQGEREPAAFIEHHKAGDNLVWDDPGGKKTALYTHPSPTLAELRAKVKAMLTSSFSGVAYTDLVRRADVLALLGDKL